MKKPASLSIDVELELKLLQIAYSPEWVLDPPICIAPDRMPGPIGCGNPESVSHGEIFESRLFEKEVRRASVLVSINESISHLLAPGTHKLLHLHFPALPNIKYRDILQHSANLHIRV